MKKLHKDTLLICEAYKEQWGIPILISYPLWFIFIIIIDMIIKIRGNKNEKNQVKQYGDLRRG